VVAEINKIAAGQWTARLLQAAANHKTAEVDRREAEALDQALDEFDRLRAIAGHEDHATATVLYWPIIEAIGDNRIERLYDSSAGRQGRNHFACPPVPQIGPIRGEGCIG
jgi:hypothetical protein